MSDRREKIRERLERDGLADELQAIHGALDDALGDSDILWMDDPTMRQEEPVQWAAMRLIRLAHRLRQSDPGGEVPERIERLMHRSDRMDRVKEKYAAGEPPIVAPTDEAPEGTVYATISCENPECGSRGPEPRKLYDGEMLDHCQVCCEETLVLRLHAPPPVEEGEMSQTILHVNVNKIRSNLKTEREGRDDPDYPRRVCRAEDDETGKVKYADGFELTCRGCGNVVAELVSKWLGAERRSCGATVYIVAPNDRVWVRALGRTE